MHNNIERFGFDGQIDDDSSFARLRSQYETMVIHQMRMDGWVPVLAIEPVFVTERNWEEDNYNFSLTVYGVYVGKKKSWLLEGMDSTGLFLPRTTANNRSGQSSQKSE